MDLPVNLQAVDFFLPSNTGKVLQVDTLQSHGMPAWMLVIFAEVAEALHS